MLIPGNITRMQLFIVLGTVLLVIYYGLVYRPLARQARALDAPLTNTWRNLPAGLVKATPDGPDLTAIHDRLNQTQNSLHALRQATQTISLRLEPDEAVRQRLREPFQLIDFQNERQNRIDEVSRVAKEQKVTLDKQVLESFPEYTMEIAQPELLWAQLFATDQLVHLALRSKVTSLNRIRPLPVRGHSLIEGDRSFAHEIPVRLEVTAPMSAAAQLLNSLPYRPDELASSGLPEAPADKPAFFITGLFIRKSSAEKADEVSLDLTAALLIYHE